MPNSHVVKDLYDTLCEQLALLRFLIADPTQPPLFANVAQVQPTPKEQGAHTDDISIKRLLGLDAAIAAGECYSDLHIKAAFCQKAARRTVGVLQISSTHAHTRRITAAVEQINACKQGIHDYITRTYASRTERFDALRADIPGVMTVHLYRKIYCISGVGVKRVSFSWRGKDLLYSPNKENLVKKILTEREVASDTYRMQLDALLANVTATPQECLRIRRTVQKQAFSNVTYEDGAFPLNIAASMPLIVIQDHGFSYREIPDSLPQVGTRKVRSDRMHATELGMFSGEIVEAVITE